jgi:hypothetical protein
MTAQYAMVIRMRRRYRATTFIVVLESFEVEDDAE